jgi:FlaA1/EpsC-like NDP-sugar epimerase
MTTVNNLNLTEPTPQATPAASKRTISRLALLASRVPASLWRYLLIGSDALLIFAAFVTAPMCCATSCSSSFLSIPRFNCRWSATLPLVLPSIVSMLVSFRFSRVYPYQPGRSWVEETWRIATASTAGVILLIVVNLFFRPMLYSRLVFLYTAILVTIYLGVSRLADHGGAQPSAPL